MNTRDSNDMNDEDIARVFEAHDVDVPVALDDKILKSARHSDAIPTNTEVTPRNPRKNWLVPGFAIAATVMLSVAIAPLLFQSPDAERIAKPGDSDITAMAPPAVNSVASPAIDTVASPADEVATLTETLRSRTAAISEEAQATELADINTTATSEIVVAETSNEASKLRSKEAFAETRAAATARISVASATQNKSVQTPEAIDQQSISGGSASADAAQLLGVDENQELSISDLTAANRFPSYDPDKPDTWLDTIKRLAIDNKPELAREEFDKFRARYPDYQVDFRLDEFLQTLKTPEQATD